MAVSTTKKNYNSTNLISKDRLLLTFAHILATADSDEQALSDMYEATLFEQEVTYDMLNEIKIRRDALPLIEKAAKGNTDTTVYHIPLDTIEAIEETHFLFKERLHLINAEIVKEDNGISIKRNC